MPYSSLHSTTCARTLAPTRAKMFCRRGATSSQPPCLLTLSLTRFRVRRSCVSWGSAGGCEGNEEKGEEEEEAEETDEEGEEAEAKEGVCEEGCVCCISPSS